MTNYGVARIKYSALSVDNSQSLQLACRRKRIVAIIKLLRNRLLWVKQVRRPHWKLHMLKLNFFFATLAFQLKKRKLAVRAKRANKVFSLARKSRPTAQCSCNKDENKLFENNFFRLWKLLWLKHIIQFFFFHLYQKFSLLILGAWRNSFNFLVFSSLVPIRHNLDRRYRLHASLADE